MSPRPPDVAGFCPMGCGATLVLDEGGAVLCSDLNCPDPDAVDTILADCETEHVVDLGEGTFTVLHPLRERINAEVLGCRLHEHLAGLPGPPARPGRYRATWAEESWTWDLLPAPELHRGEQGRG